MISSGDKVLPAASTAESITTVGSNIGQLIMLVTLLSTPSPQVSETGGIQSTLVVPLVVLVTLLSTPSPQVSETGGIQSTLVVPLVVLVTLLSTPSPQVSETGGIQSTLVVPVTLLSMPLSQVSETGAVIGVQPSLLVEAIVPTVLLSAQCHMFQMLAV